jgi:peptide/nickel transport system substrate-binding protein
MSNKLISILALLLLASLMLTACDAGNSTTPDGNRGNTGNLELAGNEPTDEQPATDQPEATDLPEIVESSRRGSWADTVVLIEEPFAETAMSRLAVGDIDLYSAAVTDLGLLQTVEEDPRLVYTQSAGSFNELLFNPYGPIFNNGNLNPFADKRMREAMNMFVDRDYIVQEILGGLGAPQFLPLITVFPDYARIADVAKAIEAQYAYNPEKAAEQMTIVLRELGAVLVDGQWTYEGEQINLIMVIRTEDQRRAYGDYISNLLEDFGFSVIRRYENSAQASQIWSRSDPADGLWHMYTGGWTNTRISRDDAGDFLTFYTKLGYPGNPMWEAMEPSQEFFDLADQLANNQFSSLEERSEMLAEIAPMAMQESARIWLYGSTSFTPRRAEVEVTADLAGAVSATTLWTYTLRRTGKEGGIFTVGMPSMLIEPWNGIGGSNWVYDLSIIRGISDWAVIPDPYTGLMLPQRLASAEITIETGLPVGVTYDWVSLDFTDSIEVPPDAWADWDAGSQTFITVGEKFPEGRTAKSKVVCNYEDSLYEGSIWHDGSNFSIADVVMAMIINFDIANQESAIFDEGQLAPFISWMGRDFRGWRIASVDPLVVEYYSDNFQLDAENNVSDGRCGWPEYGYGQHPWHGLTIGLMAEEIRLLAFSATKSQDIGVEWTNYIDGPSLEILSDFLKEAISSSYIPYEPTLGEYITVEEALARYANLQQFFEKYGHFWVGNGPMYLEAIDPIEKTVTLQNFVDFPDLSSKWGGFAAPKLAEVNIDGPKLVAAGTEAFFDANVTFNIYVTYEGEDYPLSDIDNVKYLLFNAAGDLVEVGAAEAISDGYFQVELSRNQTALDIGENRIEIIVVPIVVSIPTLVAFEFVVE